MKKHPKFLALLLALTASVGAQAQSQSAASPIYGELSFAPIKVSAFDYSFTPKVLRGIVGYEVNPNVAIEAMLAFGIADGSTQISGVNVTGKVNSAVGLYVRPKVAIGGDLEVFGRVGFAQTNVKLSAPGFSESDSGSDLSFGAGVAYKISPATAVVADYMSYYSKDGVKASGMSVGLRMSF